MHIDDEFVRELAARIYGVPLDSILSVRWSVDNDGDVTIQVVQLKDKLERITINFDFTEGH